MSKEIRLLMTPTRSPDRDEEATAALARRILAGDSSAECEMVERYSRDVLSLLRRLTRRPELAEDLHQETFQVVLERLRGRGLAEPGRLVGFLHRTAHNLYLGNVRKRARRKTETGEGLPQTADPASDQLYDMLRAEKAMHVRGLLAELRPQRDRRILYRLYLAEEPKEKIRADFELDSAQFNRVLSRARKRLRTLLNSNVSPRQRKQESSN